MLDGTIPTEMQEKYLCIVLRETERLTKLTSGLLTLNSMDPKQNRLCRTCFDINTVIKNTVITFEGTCTSRNISIGTFYRLGILCLCRYGQDPAGPVQPD